MSIEFSRGTLSFRFQLLLLFMVLGLFAAGSWFTYNAVHITNENTAQLVSNYSGTSTTVTNFRQCVAAGNTILETSPQVCVTKSGQRFVHGK